MNINKNEQEIRRLIENWANAVRVGDMTGILAYHSDDIIMFDVPAPFQSRGIEAYRKTWDIFFKYTRPGVFDIQELKIFSGEDTAFCLAIMNCSDKSDGADYKHLDFRLTIGLKKIKDQWTIVHEHHSVPAT